MKKTICIAGKNDIAVNVLEYLINKIENIRIVVICNLTETGRNSFQKSLRYFAKKWNISEVTLEELYRIEDLVFISLEFDRLINPELFRKKALLYNVHFSDLPKNRGQYSAAWSILNGDNSTAATLHMIDRGIDTGDIIDKIKFDISELDCREVYRKLVKEGTKVVIRNIDKLLSGEVRSEKQSVSGASFHSINSIDYKNLKLNAKDTADGLARQILAYRFREYQLPKFEGVEIIDYKVTNERSLKTSGTVIFRNNISYIVSTIDYNIILYIDRFNELIEACKNGNLDIVRDVCSVNRHINERDENGWTPLVYAVKNNQTEIVNYLISLGADIRTRDNDGWNLLKFAADTYIRCGDDDLYKLLLDLGLDSYEVNYSDISVEDYLAKNNHGINED